MGPMYMICPIFFDMPTYLKIGHPLWMLPKERTLLDMLLTLIFKSRKLSKIRQAVKLKLESQGSLPNFTSSNCQNVIISVSFPIIIVHVDGKSV